MSRRKLLIASRNKGKIQEIRSYLSDVPYKILSLSDLDDALNGFDVEETAETFEGNALIKALIMGHKTGLLTLSDDSGLEIDALNGRPGVRSARYAKTDAERIQKVLDEMHEVPDQNRGAQFRCVMAVYDPVYTRVYTFSGTCKGRILHQKKGDKSFGYSPIFYFDAYGKTYGEMEIEERSSISHRGQALKKAAQYLTKSL